MKRYLLPLILLTLVSCGPSEKERMEIATITCNYISETRNMDSALRLKEMNIAREKLGEDPFLGVDDDIKDAVQYGLCKELVLNDPDYSIKLLEAKKEELRLLQITLADQRLKNEREKAKRDSIAKVKAKEREAKKMREDSIAKAKAEESRRRSQAAKRKIAEQQAQWRLKVGELLKDIPSTLEGEVDWNQMSKTLNVKVPCNYFKGLSRIVTVYFKDDLGKVEDESFTGTCYSNLLAQFNIDLSFNQEQALKRNYINPANVIERITVTVTGVANLKDLDIDNIDSEESEYFPQHYSSLNYTSKLADPFVYEIRF